MSLYSEIQTTVLSLMGELGQLATFTRTTSSGFNPATGVNTTGTSTYTAKGVTDAFNRSEIDGEIIQSGDLKFFIEASGTEPRQGDTVTIDSDEYRIMNVNKVSPAGTPVLYELQLRI